MSSREQLTGRHVHGILAPPRLSRNNNLYLPESLMLADGMRVPWYVGHEDFAVDPRTGKATGQMLELPPKGQVNLLWNSEMQRLEYDGYVWDDRAIEMIESGETPYVSLAANPKWYDVYRGHKVPMGLQFFSVSQVKNPGIPETTLTMEQVLEQFDRAAWIVRSLDENNWIVMEGMAPQLGQPAQMGMQQPGMGSPMLSEPIHPDYQKALRSMQQTYGNSDKGKQVFYATMNKHNIDYTKPAPEGAMMCDHGFPSDMTAECPMCQQEMQQQPQPQPGGGMQGPQAMAGAQAPNALTVPPVRRMQAPAGMVQGTDSYPFSSPPRGYATPAQSRYEVKEGKRKNTRSDLATEAAVKTKGGKNQPVTEETVAGDSLADPLQAQSVKHFASDPTVDAAEKNIGAPRTTFEKNLEEKVKSGTATKADMKVYEALRKVREEEEEEGAGEKIQGKDQPSKAVPGSHPTEPGNVDPTGEDHTMGSTLQNPNRSTAIPRTGTAMDEEGYGFSKDALEKLFSWSTLSKNDQKNIGEVLLSGKYPTANTLTERTVKHLRESGVLKERSISQERESRGATGRDVQAGKQPNVVADAYGFGDQWQFQGQVREMADFIAHRGRFSSPPQYLQQIGSNWGFDMPMLRIPKATDKEAIKERSKRFNMALESYGEQQNQVLLEAIDSSTTGAALGIDELAPALVIPNQYAGFARDACYVRNLPQGTNKSRISEITTPQMGPLTPNVQPTVVDPTLTTVDVTTYFRGALHQTSFRAERQIIGPYIDGLIMADRVAVLYDEDVMVFGTPNLNNAGVLSATGASGGIEGNIASVPTANQWQAEGYSTAPTAWTADSNIENTDLMSAQAISIVQKAIIVQGYAPENYVLFMHPKPYADLLNDTGIVRYLQLGAATGDARDALISQGVIPDLFGFEIRRCTTVPQTITGGSGSIPTFHAWAVKKGMTCVMSVSHDIQIETYRDVKEFSTFVSVHYDLGVQLAHPNSAVLLVSS